MAMRMANFAGRHAAQSLTFAGLAILAGWVARAEAQSARPDLMRSPFHIERILDHGERPDWSPDGRKLVFTQSEARDTAAYEIDLATRKVRCLTCKFGKLGLVTRIYYLPDGFNPIEKAVSRLKPCSARWANEPSAASRTCSAGSSTSPGRRMRQRLDISRLSARLNGNRSKFRLIPIV